MKKQLSSSSFLFYRFIFPGFLFLFMLVGGVIAIAAQNIIGGLIFLLLSILCGFIIALSWKHKEVAIDDEFLYASDIKKTIKIPLTEMISATESNFSTSSSRRIVSIDLKTKTEFGREIIFLTYGEMFLAFSMHPVTKLLQNKITSTHNKK